jgi:ElaB/YqjD/DUF883 family membrane-anchored ribosome-binding protein
MVKDATNTGVNVGKKLGAGAEKEGLKGISKLTNGAGKAMGMLGSIMAGPWGMLATAAIAAISWIVNFAEQHAKDLRQAADEAKARYEQSKQEYQNVADLKKQYDELTEAQDGTVEKKKELIELTNQITDQYPELIGYLGDEATYASAANEQWATLLDTKKQVAAQNAVLASQAEAQALPAEAEQQQKDIRIIRS